MEKHAKPVKKGFKGTKPGFRCTEFLKDSENGLYVEDYFHEMVYLEKKRSERSKKRFLLMVIDIESAVSKLNYRESVSRLSRALNSLTRETDLKGWLRRGQAVGVVFTEYGGRLEDFTVKSRALWDHAMAGPEMMEKTKVTFHVYPEENGANKAIPIDFRLYPELSKKKQPRDHEQAVKRAVDIIGALAGLALFSPFFLVIPALIKLTSSGPVFFKQTRIGQFGRPFTFLKFRSMQTGSTDEIHSAYVKKLINGENEPSQEKSNVYKITNDPRVTSVGRFLRKTSLDELPQFLNVLKGDMSLVGPRPPIPYEVESYEPWHRRRYIDVKPGLTGLWQVEGRSSTTFSEMVRMDIRYARNRSLLLDLMIIIKTPWSMVSSKGAY